MKIVIYITSKFGAKIGEATIESEYTHEVINTAQVVIERFGLNFVEKVPKDGE